MPPQRSEVESPTSPHRRARTALSALVLLIMLFSAIPTITLHASSDPGYVDNGDFTKSVLWNFTDPADYAYANTTVSGGLGMLEFVNETTVENSAAQYLLGNRTNIDLGTGQDAIVIDNTSLSVQTLTLQPGPEAIDCYLYEWFSYTNYDGTELVLNPAYYVEDFYNKRSRIVMQPDLSLVPAGATIVNATLWLYEKPSKSNVIYYSIHALNLSFVEQEVAFDRRDATNLWENWGGDFSTESFSNGTIDGTDGWHLFDLTRLVDLWVRGSAPNYGFIIVPRNERFDGTKSFVSSDAGNKPTQWPKIVVNYTVGAAVGAYESSVLGPATNATFTLANWTDGVISKGSDEFSTSSISSKWKWTKDPSLAGGSVNLDRPGWLNITGSQPTELTNASVGCNYLNQPVDGNFRAETSLEGHFSANSMGAGLLMKSDDLTWLAIYLAGVQGNSRIVAMVCKGGFSTTLNSASWTSTAAHLRIERSDGTYQLRASMDGISWSTLQSYSGQYDFTLRVSVGLCVFSGGVPSNPVAEFDFFRLQPVGQSPSLEMRVRTGNSTNTADPSWEPWGAPIGPSTGTVIGATSMYVQYQLTLSTSWEWLSPAFYGFTCHDERFLPEGVITTEAVYQVDLSVWDTMTVTQSATGGKIEYSYSTNGGSTWQFLGSGASFSLGVTEPSMMLRMAIRTYDTLVTPSIDTIELRYSVSIASFQITAPGTVIAGEEFNITIEARDPSNNLATGWNGTVTIHAMNAAGTSDASDEVYVTTAYVPLGGVVNISNQAYDFAETIRISVSAGTVRGMTAGTIVVQPGSATTLTMNPGDTTMFDHTSMTFTATAYDAYGNMLAGASYAWTADASLGTLNSTSGRVVELTAGDYFMGGYLNVTCSGLNVSRWIDVLPAALPPSFTSPLPDQIKTEDSGEWTLDLSGYVTDLEDPHSKLRWYASNESIVEVRGENRTGNLMITFLTKQDAYGSCEVYVSVVDSSGMKTTTTLNVTIEPVNDPPIIAPIEPLVVQYDVQYVYDLTQYVYDSDNPFSQLNFSVDGASAPYAVVYDRYITFTYPESMMGTTQTVIIIVKDWAGASDATAVFVRVSDDRVPQLTNTLPNVMLDQGTTLEDCAFLAEHFYDPDDVALTYDWTCEHSIIGIDGEGHVNVTAPNDWFGVEYAVIRAVDPHGARAEGIMQITVRQVNHPATIGDVPDLKVRYDQRYKFDVAPYVEDADDFEEELLFTADDPHCTFTGSVMSILYPIGMNNTVNPVLITVWDDEYSASCSITITVSNNYPPELFSGNPLPDHSFLEDLPIRYPMAQGLEGYFWDQEDGQALSFEVFSLSDDVTAVAMMDITDGWRIELNTTQDYFGTSGILIRAKDSSGAIIEQVVVLEVTAVADAPVLNLPSAYTVIEGQQTILDLAYYISDPDSSLQHGDFTFTIQMIGRDGDEAEYLEGISTIPGMLLFEYPSGFLKDHDSTFTIEVVATDQDGKVARGEIEIKVSKAPRVGESPLMLSMAILATIGGVSGMGAIAYVRRKKPFVIRDVMLIHNDGFLIGRYAGHPHTSTEIDQDILSGMMTAVLNFVEDSMLTSHETLKTFGFKDYQVLVRRGTKTFAAIAYEGDLPDTIETPVKELLGTFERIYKKKISSWTGDIETDFAGVEVLIQGFVKEHSKKAGRKARKLWVAKRARGGETLK